MIRHLFERYLALGNVRWLQAELIRENVVLPVRARLNGNGTIGGGWFQRGQIYKFLSNPVYIGRIAHGATNYQGLHPAIIDTAQWNAVQAGLAANRQGTRTQVRAASPSLLAGQVIDEAGEPLIATHASKGGRRYRYYVSRSLNENMSKNGSRISALELEAAICQRIADAFDDPLELAGTLDLTFTSASIAAIGQRGREVAAGVCKRSRAVVDALVGQVRVHPRRIEIELVARAVASALDQVLPDDESDRITLVADVTLARSGRALRLVHDTGAAAITAANPALVRLLVKARRWWKVLREGEIDVTSLAASEGVMPAYVTRIVRLAFLSPEVIAAILCGRVRAEVNSTTITASDAIPVCWKAQAKMMLPGVRLS